MVVERLKAVLTVLAEKSTTLSERCRDHVLPEPTFSLPEELLSRKIDLAHLEGAKELLNLKKKLMETPEEKYMPLLHEMLLVVFSNTTQKLRQCYLKELLDHFQEAMTRNILKSADPSSVISKLEYQRQIRQCLPLVKLDIVEQLLKRSTPAADTEAAALKIAIEELYECVRFPRILREECNEIVAKKLGSKHFDLQKFELQDIDEKLGTLGVYAKLRITVKYEDKLSELCFFAKFMLEKGHMQSSLSENTFKKEEFMYTVFIPLLKQLGAESLTNFLPECYLVRANEMILLEDVSVQGYFSSNVSETFDFEHLLKAVKQFAKLHAATFVIEDKLSKLLGDTITLDEYYGEYFEEFVYHPNSKFRGLVIDFMKYFLKKFPDMPKKLSAKVITNIIEGQFGDWYDAMKKSGKYRNALCQGDSWCNNIMFQHDEGGTVQSCYLVDYQMTRYCPPAVEVLCFLYCTTDKKTRSKHMTLILKAYYSELTANLSDNGVDIEDIYPFDKFMECCESMKLPALFHSLMCLHYILIPKDKLDEMKRDEKILRECMSGDKSRLIDTFWYHLPFRTRLTENIEEICEICENMEGS